MSLLNQMLRDLDNRRAADSERHAVPGNVRPLPPAPKVSPLPYGLTVVALAALAIGLVWWAPWQPRLAPPLPVVAAPAPITPPPAAVAPSAPAPQPPVAALPAAQVKVPVSPVASGPGKDVPGEKRPASPPAPVADKGGEKKADKPVAAAPAGGPGRFEKSLSPASPQAQAENEYRRAQGLLAQGNRSEAEAALSQVLRLAPEHVNARQALFGLLVEQQRKDEARALLQAGVDILPGHSTWAMNIARLQMEKGDAAGAWETLQRSLASAQNNGEYRAFCGTVLQRLGRAKEAIEHFHAALRINPGEGRWWLGLALVLESADHPAEAREAYARARNSGNLPADLAAFAEQKSRP